MKNVLNQLNIMYRDNRKEEIKLSKEVDELISQLENKNMPYKDYMSVQGEFNFKSKQLYELNQYNNGLHDAREIILENMNCDK